LENELEICDYASDPVRVRCIGTGVLSEWNGAHPNNPICLGDRVAKVNGMRDRDSIVAEIRNGHQWAKYELNLTLMRKVTVQSHGLEAVPLLPTSAVTETILVREEPRLKEALNVSQIAAVGRACTHRLCLIQGPPGTGKTTLAVEMLDFLLLNELVPTPILVTGHTNASVDNILAGLAQKGKRLVRIGERDKVRLECRPYVLGEEKAAEPQTAEVICATCIGSGSGIFSKEGLRFHTVLIDECSQATETSCLVPVCHGAQQVILIGDQCQLQPFVQSEFAKAECLGDSLFNRLHQQGVQPVLLDTQYRMHPTICDFPSEAFYNGQLMSGVRHSDRLPTAYWQWPSRMVPVSFIDAAEGSEGDHPTNMERKNEYEVSLVMRALSRLLMDPELKSLSSDGTYPIGIVTPYAAQRDCILTEIMKHGLFTEEGKSLVETNSVDGFQGREKDIIIFSAVRANDTGSVGFLHDWRRINVLLTRAKRGLIVIGHRQTLQTDVYWRNWLKWAAMKGCIQGEAASGVWTPKCLVADEWAMKPRVRAVAENISSRGAQEEVWTPEALKLQMPATFSRASGLTDEALSKSPSRAPESWEDFAPSPIGTLLPPSAMGFADDLHEDLLDSWEDLVATPNQAVAQVEHLMGFLEKAEFSDSCATCSSEDEFTKPIVISLQPCRTWEPASEPLRSDDKGDAEESQPIPTLAPAGVERTGTPSTLQATPLEILNRLDKVLSCKKLSEAHTDEGSSGETEAMTEDGAQILHNPVLDPLELRRLHTFDPSEQSEICEPNHVVEAPGVATFGDTGHMAAGSCFMWMPVMTPFGPQYMWLPAMEVMMSMNVGQHQPWPMGATSTDVEENQLTPAASACAVCPGNLSTGTAEHAFGPRVASSDPSDNLAEASRVRSQEGLQRQRARWKQRRGNRGNEGL